MNNHCHTVLSQNDWFYQSIYSRILKGLEYNHHQQY